MENAKLTADGLWEQVCEWDAETIHNEAKRLGVIGELMSVWKALCAEHGLIAR